MELKGFRVPVCIVLTKVPTVLGISRDAFFLNTLLAVIFIVSLKMYMMILFFILTHMLLGIICKKDPQIIEIFLKKYIKQKDYYYED